ncbi:hypothetical protein D3C86_2190530 [compost metagenome]
MRFDVNEIQPGAGQGDGAILDGVGIGIAANAATKRSIGHAERPSHGLGRARLRGRPELMIRRWR